MTAKTSTATKLFAIIVIVGFILITLGGAVMYLTAPNEQQDDSYYDADITAEEIMDSAIDPTAQGEIDIAPESGESLPTLDPIGNDPAETPAPEQP
jgi:uncharacterized membrane protein